MQLDPLGIDREPVTRLEALFRAEIARLSQKQMPSRTQMRRAIQSSRTLSLCSGQEDCLSAIGKKVGVDLIVSGSVAGLADSYVVNIKVVDVATQRRIRRNRSPVKREI